MSGEATQFGGGKLDGFLSSASGDMHVLGYYDGLAGNLAEWEVVLEHPGTGEVNLAAHAEDQTPVPAGGYLAAT